MHEVVAHEFDLNDISIKPIGSDGSRLSIPVRIEGVDRMGRRVRYFGKIIGGSDILTARTIQFFKNVYLELSEMEPMFDMTRSAKEMARHQHDSLLAIGRIGIPTARPYGYYPVTAEIWLLVAEFIDAKPVSAIGSLPNKHLDTVFDYLRRMHKAGIFHGDIKPENLMLGDRVYLVDVGHFAENVPPARKKAYDLACQVASLLDYAKPDEIVRAARRYYSRKDLKSAADFIDLVQKRPDINFPDEIKERLIRLLREGEEGSARKEKRRAPP